MGSDLLWVYGFRFSFTPLTGVLFAFPSRYFSAIGCIKYLALDRGRPRFRQGFSCLAVLRYRQRSFHYFVYGDFTLSVRLSQNLSTIMKFYLNSSPCGTTALQPHLIGGLGSSSFARRYFRNHYYFLFPGYLDGSVPPVSLPHPIYSDVGWQVLTCQVTPFGYQRIIGCLLLPVASRSLPRPSSPQYAKASTVNPIFTWPYYPSIKSSWAFAFFSVALSNLICLNFILIK